MPAPALLCRRVRSKVPAGTRLALGRARHPPKAPNASPELNGPGYLPGRYTTVGFGVAILYHLVAMGRSYTTTPLFPHLRTRSRAARSSQGRACIWRGEAHP